MKTWILDLITIEPRTFKQLRSELELSSYKEANELNAALKELQKESKIFFKKRGETYHKKDKLELIGTYFETKNDYGFVEIEGYSQKSFFIPGRFTLNALHGDTVRIMVLPAKEEGKDPIGKIVRVMQRNGNNLVGMVTEGDDGHMYIEVHNNASKYPYQITNPGQHKVGDIVVAKFLDYFDFIIKVKVIENIGVMTAKKDWEIVSKRHDLDIQFPVEVEEAAKKKLNQPIPSGRKDVTDRLTVTIDGVYSKDLDDAIDIEVLKNGHYRLGVHIADVAHYVEENSVIDQEAYNRGTSVYLIDKVLPMLPETLSNDLCSLNPNTKKLAMSVDMEINKKGKVVKAKLYESVIESKYRLTYNEVEELLEGRVDMIHTEELTQMLRHANEIAQAVRKVKLKSGMIDFVLPELSFELDEDGEPVQLNTKYQSASEKLIEDLMVVTNETVAKELGKEDAPALFRIHPKPKIESIDNFKLVAELLGHKLDVPSEDVGNKEFMELIEGLGDDHISLIIKRMLIQTMEKAVYSPYDEGHFGQGLENYLHFTSPIRRYPDLLVHRTIKDFIFNNKGKANTDERIEQLGHAAKQTSDRERLAMSAERKLMDIKKVRLMKDEVGKYDKAIAVTITNFGIFLELENFTQGLVRFESMKNLEDKNVEPGKKAKLILKDGSSAEIKLGQEVDILISDIDVARGLMDFEIHEDHFTKQKS